MTGLIFTVSDLPVIPQNIPDGVIQAYNELGGADSDPASRLYRFRVQEQDTYAVALTWGGGDGFLVVLDYQGQQLGATYIVDQFDLSGIQWYDSFAEYQAHQGSLGSSASS